MSVPPVSDLEWALKIERLVEDDIDEVLSREAIVRIERIVREIRMAERTGKNDA